MRKIIVSAALVTAFAATPALADFYIVQDTSTKHCTIVEQKPTVTTMTVVGGNKVYKTRVEADNAMKTEKICETSPH
jgi:vancomycin permeability regulator SanA